MQNFWDKLFNWLERVLPTALATFVFGYRLGNKDKNKIEALLAKNEYELKKMKAVEEVKKKYEGKSDADVVNEFLSGDKSGKS